MSERVEQRCPFDEQDCLHARSLLYQAVKRLASYEKDDTYLLTADAMKDLRAFLKDPYLQPLLRLIRTGKVI